MKKLSTMLLAAVLAFGLLGAGCGNDTHDADNSGGSSTGTGRNGIETFSGGDEPLDDVQALLYEALAQQLAEQAGGANPGAEEFLKRVSYALIYLLQGPDQVVAALASGDSSQFGTAGGSLASNLTIAVDELLCAIGSLAAPENCQSLSTGGVPGEFSNLEALLLSLQGELGEGEGADFSAMTAILEDLVLELQTLATSEDELPGDPYASSLFELLAQLFGDTADIIHAFGVEDPGDANDAFVGAIDNLLNNLLIGLPQIDDDNPELADQIENELSIVLAGVDSYSEDLITALIMFLLDPLSDLVGPVSEGFEGGLG
jgi:hypothetical protein